MKKLDSWWANEFWRKYDIILKLHVGFHLWYLGIGTVLDMGADISKRYNILENLRYS
jgi:hypothetical protein